MNILCIAMHNVGFTFSDVPGPIATEPVVTDAGKNWITISWTKPEHRGAAPILAYRVEAWELGSEGGAMWHEVIYIVIYR